MSARVTVERRFRRSIRVDTDRKDAANGFVWTPTASRAIGVVSEHVSALRHSAFTWTGPYGCGKSSLAALLAAVVAASGSERAELLSGMPESVRQDIERTFGQNDVPWTVLPVVGRRADPEGVIGEALKAAGLGGRGKVVDRLLSAKSGLLLILDEMGKLLEHAATDGGDAYFFQELAEAANRSEGRLVVVGVLHQAFDDYSVRLARESRDEWLKVQGRFVDVPLAPTGEEQIELLSKAIVAHDAPDTTAAAMRVAAALRGGRSGEEATAVQLAHCSPLNPVVAALLGPISKRRFGQNQRSLFGFLGSAEPYGFQDFLLQHGGVSLYEPSMLWSYLRTNLEPSIMASPDSHRWSLAIDAVERCEARAADEVTLRVVKAIALIDMFRERSGFAASPSIIAAALADEPGESISAALERLLSWSVIVHRRHLDAFSLFAGSDFDIDEAVEEARRTLTGCDFGKLRSSGVLSPVLAKRHYHDTGAMRWFEIDVATIDEAMSYEFDGKGASGSFLLVVNDAGLTKASLRSRMARIAERLTDQPVVLGVTSQSYLLREMTLDLIALDKVQALSGALKGDAVARREIAGRANRLTSELEDRLRDSLASANWSVPMFEGIELEVPTARTGPARLSVLASVVADTLFPDAPTLRNELLNRGRPSSSAMAALRALMTAMVSSEHSERLGIEDYPAEMGLYISLLERTGLHAGRSGVWSFQVPAVDDAAGLSSAWKAADRLLDGADRDGLTLSAIYEVWSARPFGIKTGLLPVLALAFILSRMERLSVYLDGLFCSSINDLLVDRMLQEASAVRIRRSVISPEHQEMLVSVGDMFAKMDGGEATQIEPLALARRLVGYVVELPGWVRRTSRLGATAKAVRDLATTAHDPNRFMLDDLPAALEGAPEGRIPALRRGLDDLAVAYGDLLSTLSTVMLDELRVGPGRNELDRLRSRARTIVGLTGNFRLDAYATRLGTFDGTQSALEGILSLAANRPPRDWTDRDVDAATLELASLSQEFLRAEGFAHVQGRTNNRTRMALFISDPGRPSLMKSELSVGEAERGRVRLLAQQLRARIGQDVSIDIALAVVAELGAGLIEERDACERQDADVPIRGVA